MTPDTIKLYAPWLFLAVWLLFALRTRSPYLAGAGLFLASFAGFSQNFSFIYRDLHQLIQVILIALALFVVVRTGRLYRFNIIFLVLILLVGLSLLFSTIDDYAKTQAINLAVMIGMTNYLYLAIEREGGFDRLMTLFASLAGVAAIIGIVEYLTQPTLRAEATMANPNYFAYFLGIGFCVAYDRFTGGRRLTVLLLIVIAIFLSGSRSAFIFPAIQIGWHLHHKHGTWRQKLLPLLALLAGAVILAFGSSRFTDTDITEASDAERIIFAQIALQMANDNPLTGVGWGRYANEFGNYTTTVDQIILTHGEIIDAYGQDKRVTHSDLLRILAELGWPAAIASIWLCTLGLVKVYRQSLNHHGYFFACWTGSLLFSLTHNNLNSVLFWFIFMLPFMTAQPNRIVKRQP